MKLKKKKKKVRYHPYCGQCHFQKVFFFLLDPFGYDNLPGDVLVMTDTNCNVHCVCILILSVKFDRKVFLFTLSAFTGSSYIIMPGRILELGVISLTRQLFCL